MSVEEFIALLQALSPTAFVEVIERHPDAAPMRIVSINYEYGTVVITVMP